MYCIHWFYRIYLLYASGAYCLRRLRLFLALPHSPLNGSPLLRKYSRAILKILVALSAAVANATAESLLERQGCDLVKQAHAKRRVGCHVARERMRPPHRPLVRLR